MIVVLPLAIAVSVPFSSIVATSGFSDWNEIPSMNASSGTIEYSICSVSPSFVLIVPFLISIFSICGCTITVVFVAMSVPFIRLRRKTPCFSYGDIRCSET